MARDPYVVGVDLSLTGTGVAIIDGGLIQTFTYGTKGSRGATLPQRAERLLNIVAAVRMYTERADFVVIEGPAFGQNNPGTHDRSGLWWLVVDRLCFEGYPIAVVPPTTLKKYVTGKGNAQKDEVMLAVAHRYPDAEVKNNNEADALGLAAMGARHLGATIDGILPARNIEAMDAVEWPVVT